MDEQDKPKITFDDLLITPLDNGGLLERLMKQYEEEINRRFRPGPIHDLQMSYEIPDEIVMLLDKAGIDSDQIWAVKYFFSRETGWSELEVKFGPHHEWTPVRVDE